MSCADAFFARRWAPFALIGLITALVWGYSITFQFVWDDRSFIQELESIRSLKNVPEMFYSLEAQSSRPESFKLFRPLRTVHYALLYQLSGERAPLPWLYHFSNLAWHAGAAMLLHAVAILLFQQLLAGITERKAQWLGLFTAIAFAVHPVVSEVVCWAKSLDDAMAAVFTLASMHALLKWEGDRKNYGLALLWFLLAMYSKISAVPFAVAAFLIFYQVRRIPFVRATKLSSGFFVLALAFMVHRHFVIGQSNQTAPLSGSYGQTLIDMFPVVPKYLRLLCGVPPFCIDYSFMKGHHAILSAPVLAGAALLLIAAIVTGFAFRKPDGALAAFGLLWFGAFLLPVSNLLPMMQYMAERFLYLPLIGWLFALAWLIHRVPRWQWSTPMVAAGLIVWAALALNRSLIWRDEITLFVNSSREHPGIRRVENNAVAAIFDLPHVRAMFTLDQSTQELHVAANLPPEKCAAIRDTLAEAHRLFPRDEHVATALGILHAAFGRPHEAVPFFKIAVERHPKNARYWSNLGKASMEANAWAEAKTAVVTALSLAPEDLNALRTASQIAWQTEDYPAATNYFTQLRRLEPGQPDHTRWLREAEAKLAARSRKN